VKLIDQLGICGLVFWMPDLAITTSMS